MCFLFFYISLQNIFVSSHSKKHIHGAAPHGPPWAECSISALGTQVGAWFTVMIRLSWPPMQCGQLGTREGPRGSFSAVFFFTALELDKNRVIETAPLSFRTLLGVLGIEATLESLIKSLCTEEQVPTQ